jgi:hypothetical protein
MKQYLLIDCFAVERHPEDRQNPYHRYRVFLGQSQQEFTEEELIKFASRLGRRKMMTIEEAIIRLNKKQVWHIYELKEQGRSVSRKVPRAQKGGSCNR